MIKTKLVILTVISLSILVGCMTAAQHQQNLPSTQERETTVGIVQREIRVGMSGAQVAEALGSPNIVTQDSEGDETWIYDKIASEASYSQDSGGTGGLMAAAVRAYRRLVSTISAATSHAGALCWTFAAFFLPRSKSPDPGNNMT